MKRNRGLLTASADLVVHTPVIRVLDETVGSSELTLEISVPQERRFDTPYKALSSLTTTVLSGLQYLLYEESSCMGIDVITQFSLICTSTPVEERTPDINCNNFSILCCSYRCYGQASTDDVATVGEERS